MIETKYEYGRIINGDCLEIIDKLVEEGIKVDCVITDLPYGTTNCSWDNIIPFEPMWEKLNKITKENGAIVLFGAEPFSSKLRMSNLKNYKYDWKWNKGRVTGHLNAKKQPLRLFEDVCVFYRKQCVYNPQMKPRDKVYISKGSGKVCEKGWNKIYNSHKSVGGVYTEYYPTQELKVSGDKGNKRIHPTQKPTELLEFLIKTYSNEGDLILDITAGSMSLAQACINTNRNFICIEQNKEYYELGINRISGYIKE